MLKFQIDDLELKETIQSSYGKNTDILVRDFVGFLREKQISEDVSIAIEQLEQGKCAQISTVMKELRNKLIDFSPSS